MPRSRTLVALLALIVVALAGCSNKKSNDTGSLPAGDQLIQESAAVMRDAQTAHVTIEADTTISDVRLKRADGDVTRDGNAQGNLQLDQAGNLVEFNFVIIGDAVYLKGATGGWQKLSLVLAAAIYDPSAILDPDRGIAKILATATQARTEGQEKVDGADTYRVAATLDNTAVASLVPGVSPGVTGKFWIDVQTKQLRKAVLDVPAKGTLPKAIVDVKVTNVGTPVTINAPI